MPTPQTLLPRGVIVVVADNTDAALTGASALVASGIDQAALVAVPPATDPGDALTGVPSLVRRHGHAVLVCPTPTPAAVAAAVASGRALGHAATVVTVGDVTDSRGWRARRAELGADRVVVLETAGQLLPYTGGVDLRAFTGAFAVIGDVHGCQRTLEERLLPALGWSLDQPGAPLLVSVGDVHDKGPSSVASLRWWLAQMRAGAAVMTDSNHARALVRALTRPDLPVRDCVADTLAQVDAAPDGEQLRRDIRAVFGSLPTHLALPGVVAVHAALTEKRLWREDAETRRFAIHTRYHLTPWQWTGTQTLVHGHDTVAEVTTRQAAPSILRPGHVPGPVVNVDTGAYAGGGLSAYRSWTGTTVTVPSVPEEITSTLEVEMSPLCA